ncbi:MAG: hypothetical protein JJT96_16795 [Opitutales bacterium]|nr:hypothetical protein [Opitutales bacterium]
MKFFSKFGFLAGILGLALLTTAVLLFLNSRYVARFSEPPTLEQEDVGELIVEERSAPQTVEEVLANYRSALGREMDLDRLQTLRMAGIMRNNEDTFPVQLSRHISGDHLHLTLHNRREPRTFIWRPNAVTIVDLEGGEQPFDNPYLANRFDLDAWVFFLPLQPNPRRLPLVFVGRETFRGFEYDVLETTPAAPLPARFYFEATTGLLRFRELPAFEDHPPELDEFLEYRRVEGIRFPFRVLYMRDGKYEGDFAATRVEVNPGMLR